MAHVLIPTGLEAHEESALVMGLQLAAARRARATVLHVATPVECPSPAHWLDGIDRLHQAWAGPDRRAPLAAAHDAVDHLRAQAEAFLDRALSDSLRKSAAPRIECRLGDPAREIVRFVREHAVDTAVIAHRRARWSLPVYPRLARRLTAECGHCQVLLVPSVADGSARKLSFPVGKHMGDS